jgi:hypothetical protein
MHHHQYDKSSKWLIQHYGEMIQGCSRFWEEAEP